MNDQFDPAKPCKTRGGSAVRIYATDGKHPYPIHGAYLGVESGGWVPCSWDSLGRADFFDKNHHDLVNVVPDVVRYAPALPTCGYGSASEAHRVARQLGASGVVKITIRDGRDVSVEVERV